MNNDISYYLCLCVYMYVQYVIYVCVYTSAMKNYHNDVLLMYIHTYINRYR